MIARVFHNWERRLASVSTDRVARPFEWGTDWLADEPLPPGDPRSVLQAWGEATIARSDAVLSPSTPARRLRARRRRAHVHERRPHAASREQHRPRALLSRRLAEAAAGARCSCCRSGTPTPRGTSGCAGCSTASACRRCASACPITTTRMPPELTPRRLHRQRQRRPDGAGLPAGGARRAARDRLAARAGLRVDRHPRHQPRLVPRRC